MHPLLIAAEKDQHEFFQNFPVGEETVVVVSSDRLLENLRRAQWDLLVLDCGTDLQQGLTLLREIKPACPGIPILFIAEAGSAEAVISAFRLGARDYVRKPFEVLELKSRIENLLQLKRGSREKRQFVPLQKACLRPVGEIKAGDYIPLNIIRSIKFMEGNLPKTVVLDDLAGEAGLSRHHFCRIFGAVMKMPPMKFLNYLRVQRAKQLLGRNGLNCSVVAMKVGFDNVNNLNKWFKVFEGISPSRYRSRNRDF
jgi:AraC-like DNA-binding protein